MQAAGLSIVMPAHNEEACIGQVVQDAVKAGQRFAESYEVIVVDDGSTDRTGERVEEASDQARLVRHPTNLGYGAAMQTCLAEAKYDLIVFLDADNQFELEEVGRLLNAIEHADVVVGSRSPRRDSMVRRLAAGAWNGMVRFLFHVPARDVDCGFKLFRRSALDDLHLKSRGAMVSTELLVRLAHAGRTIVEVDVSHRARDGGSASGMRPSVVARAFVELARLFPELSRLSRDGRINSKRSAAMCVVATSLAWSYSLIAAG